MRDRGGEGRGTRVRNQKAVTLTTTEAVARIDKMVPILYRNVVNAIRIEATLEVGNDILGTMDEIRARSLLREGRGND